MSNVRRHRRTSSSDLGAQTLCFYSKNKDETLKNGEKEEKKFSDFNFKLLDWTLAAFGRANEGDFLEFFDEESST